MNLTEFKNSWRDSRDINEGMHVDFSAFVNKDAELKAHRDWVESNIFGFGERSFHWLHKIIVDELPLEFKFLEIGGFRMQVVSLYQLLANRTNRKIKRFCVSPMSGMGGHWESDYFADSKRMHEAFGLNDGYVLFHGSSTDPAIMERVAAASQFDVVYIDGGHDYETVASDMATYAPMVKRNGYLVCDDCSNNLSMWPGCFPGIYPVSKAVDEYMGSNKDFEHLGAVMHNRVWKRI